MAVESDVHARSCACARYDVCVFSSGVVTTIAMSSLQCNGCGSSSTALKFVSCLHTLCVPCLQNSISFDGSIKCPKCLATTPLTVTLSVESLRSLPSVLDRGDCVAGEETQGKPMCEEC
eukprot:scpid111701/ scgid14295/ 